VIVHHEDCRLAPVRWLRHAAAAAGALAQDPPDDLADRTSAAAFADAVALLVELGHLNVTLADVAAQALTMDEEQLVLMCTCGALGR
jgi:hypothetical protein